MADDKELPPVAGGSEEIPQAPPPPPPKPPERARDADVIDALIDLSVDVTHIGHYLTRDGARTVLQQLKSRGFSVWLDR